MPQWQHLFAARTLNVKSSAIREILKVTAQPEVISFAGGLPAPESFPVARVQEATTSVLQHGGARALQYGPTEGVLPLREWVALEMTRRGTSATADQVLITTGSQQALDLLGKLFIDPGSEVAVEEPSYLGALQAWSVYQADYLTSSMDERGIVPEAFDRTLAHRPKLAYVLPNFQNPTGVSLSLERRREVAALARKHGVLLVEDDPYGKLRFHGEELPCLHSFAPDNTLYLSTFSKTVAPGLRVAWVVGPQEIISRLAQLKQASDLHTSTLNQWIIHEVVKDGFLDTHIPFIRQLYAERCHAMLQALESYMPEGVHWTRPDGGMFLWVTLPEGMNAETLLLRAVEHKVAFVPGAPFFPQGGGQNTLRLNFTNATLERIQEGIMRLARVLEHERHG
jgi:2-aminoadipate transaminase